MTVTLERPGDAKAPALVRLGGYAAKNSLKCDRLTQVEQMPQTYPEELKVPFSPFLQSLLDSGNAFEEHIAQRLRAEADPRQVVVIDEARDANGERTEEAKRQKELDTWVAYTDPQVRFIFNARIGGHFESKVTEYLGVELGDTGRISEPDAIELGPVMGNGLRAMRFVDVKDHKVTSGRSPGATTYPASPLSEPFYGAPGSIELEGKLKYEDWMQLAHYYRHAESLHLTDEAHSLWAAVIGREQVLVWAHLEDIGFLKTDPVTGKKRPQTPLELNDAWYERTLELIQNARAADVDPSVEQLTFPEWKADCKECPFRQVCLEELQAHGDGGHITLLPGITPDRAKVFYSLGVSSIGDLARLDPDDPQHSTQVSYWKKAVHQARVTKAGKVCRAPRVHAVNLPRAAIEIDFDYEASSSHLYQRGVRATGRRVTRGADETRVKMRVEHRVFDDFSATDEGELRVFVEMWAYFQEMLEKAHHEGHDIRFYHYSHYERTQDLRLAAKYAGQPGVPSVAEVEAFYASDLVIDMYQVLKSELVWPTKSHSIKELAKWIRFSWRDETPGGDQSMVWYAAACNDPDPAVREANITRLREYNEDDVAAQLALREWLSKLGEARKLPSVEDLPAPWKPRAR
jgi:predicted RecB family nuclease